MSIKLKVVIGVVLVLLLGTIGLLYISNQSYERNVELMAKKTLSNAHESFENLKRNDYKMMTAVIEELVRRTDIKSAFAEANRDKLIEIIKDDYEIFKTKYGITQYNFYTPGDTCKLMLAMSNLKKFGQAIGKDRKTLYDAVKNQKITYGMELGTQGFAIRVTKPFKDGDKLLGYIGLGEEINKFCSVLKELTGNEFGLVLQKKFLKEKDWETTMATLNKKNNWNDDKNLVIASNTSDDESFLKYSKEFDKIPNEGEVLGEVSKGDKVFVKGVFPIFDVNNNRAGGFFFLQDISNIYNGMQETRNTIVLFIIIQAVLICLIILILLFRLIFKRLTIMIEKIEFVVGGEFYTEIKPQANDEIGKFEVLFEQFRKVFVGLLEQHGSKQ